MAEQETLRVDRVIGAFGLVCLAILVLFAVVEFAIMSHVFLHNWLIPAQAETADRQMDAVDRILVKHPGITRIVIGNGADAITVQLGGR